MNIEYESLPPEFSVVIRLETIGDQPRFLKISASDEERMALAKRFSLVNIDELSAELALKWRKTNEVLSLKGHFSARVTQSCVLTLNPVDAELNEEIDILFSQRLENTMPFVDPNESELLDSLEIDVGEIVAEELSLSIEPYPRCKNIDPETFDLGHGAQFVSGENTRGEVQDLEKKPHPFDALAIMKPKIQER
jgi:uncharacterized metal-binding protein YceD (DUF177 family)